MIYKNGLWLDTENINECAMADSLTLYEVIRVFNSAPVFLEDNISRLKNSVSKSKCDIDVDKLDFRGKITMFIERVHLKEGNIKYLLHIKGNGVYDEYIEQIPHNYPTASMYANGVSTASCNAVRDNPEIKYLNTSLRDKANQLISKLNVFEILLVNTLGEITEGSRSNVFFVKDGELYTAPDSLVLPGTARKRTIALAKELDIPVNMECAELAKISQFDAAFITGTSPLILPINKINANSFDVNEPTMRLLMQRYFKLMTQ